jgi:hypothetical protein
MTDDEERTILLDIFVHELHQPMKDFDDVNYTDILDLIQILEWKNKKQITEERRTKGSRIQQAEDNVLRANNII